MTSRANPVLATLAATCLTAAAFSTSAGATTTPDSELAGDITVFAAASLTDSFTAIGEEFESAHPDVDITFNFAASSDLVGQINEGAPADVFASADQNNMDKLTDAGNNADEPQTFATNSLAIIVEPGNPEGITGVESLEDPDLIVVTCAPEVPIGGYSQEVFDNAGVEVEPDSFEENVKGVVTKVVEGEADAGLVYATDVIAAGDDAEGVEIPADINLIAEYPIAVTADAPTSDGAAAFEAFVLSDDGQEILAEYGFGPLDGGAADATGTSEPSTSMSDSTTPATTEA